MQVPPSLPLLRSEAGKYTKRGMAQGTGVGGQVPRCIYSSGCIHLSASAILVISACTPRLLAVPMKSLLCSQQAPGRDRQTAMARD